MKKYDSTRPTSVSVLFCLLSTGLGACGGTNSSGGGDGGPKPSDATAASDTGPTDASTASDVSTEGGAAGDGGMYPTVQSAITAAVKAALPGDTTRIYILVSPGTYREVVCVPLGAPPITLYSTNADPTQTVIVFNNYNGEATDAGTPNPCTAGAATTYGTAGSATFAAFADGFEAENITFSNDVTVATLAATSGTQAVALMTEADKIILENVQVLGHQDTLYMETPSEGTVVRSYVKSSYISGDTDFIFGGATMAFDSCQIQYVSDRKLNGSILAPDTAALNQYGILVVSGMFTADSTATPGAVGLGRAWDRSCVDVPTYLSTCVTASDYPNGQALVSASMLGAQIAANPWFPAATTQRGFCGTPWECLSDAGPGGVCPANRLYEYQNTGAGAEGGDAGATDGGQGDDGSAAVAATCTDTRPQLTSAQAAQDTILDYMAKAGVVTSLTVDNWDPTAGVGDVTSFTPTYTVGR
jgi:pectinesterase